MAKTIIFGRAVSGKDTKQIARQDISGQHTKITYLGNEEFEVEDLNSTNGTYVNGYRIRKSKVTINDEVRLSHETIIDLAKEFGLSKTAVQEKQNPNDFVSEFEKLKAVREEYRTVRRKMRKKHNRKNTLIRGTITMAPLPLMFFGDVSIMGISILGSTVAGLVLSNSDIQDELEDLMSNYNARYVCPKCKRQLGLTNPWESIHEIGKCFNTNCNAIYNKKNL